MLISYIVQPSLILRTIGSTEFSGLVVNPRVIAALFFDRGVSRIVREDPTLFLIHFPDTQAFIHQVPEEGEDAMEEEKCSGEE